MIRIFIVAVFFVGVLPGMGKAVWGSPFVAGSFECLSGNSLFGESGGEFFRESEKTSQTVVPEDEIKNIRHAYENNTQVSMDISYKVYSSHYTANPVETSVGSYRKRGKEYVSSINGIVTLQNNKFLLVVDPEQENILISNPKKSLGLLEGVPLETLLSAYAKPGVSNIDGKNRRLTLTFQDQGAESDEAQEVEKIEIYYNASTYLIYKFILFYGEPMSIDEEKPSKEKPRLEIAFSHINLKPAFGRDDFSEKTYLIQKGSKLVGTNNYKSYQIIDQRIKK